MKIELASLSGKRKPADLFFVGAFEGDKSLKALSSLEPDFTKSAQAAIPSGRFAGKKRETLSSFNPTYREASEIVLVGLGNKTQIDLASLRSTVGRLIQLARSRKVKRVRFLLDSFLGGKIQSVQAVEIITETTLLASYEFDKYRAKKKDENGDVAKSIQTLEILFSKQGDHSKLQKALDLSSVIAEGTIQARDLVNEPGNIINPASLAAEAKRIARAKKFQCTIMGYAELKRLKMGGILGVNQGSKVPPALIIMEHGAQYKKRGTLCIIGKGVTFDTGGISIKPASDMEKMKYDKAGACTVIATMGTISDLKLPVHVIGLAPAVENMPSENPQRPGDIVKMFSGKTVEVINTDAEGRLILADALAYSAKYKPRAIIDLATLTGMCAYTFGEKAIGLLGNDEKLLNRVKDAGEAVGERCWELPLWDDYADMIKGHHSDLQNIGGKYAGTITAAMFLKEFVPEKTPWAHLDIAGTAWADSPRPDCPKGATGVGVRLLVNLIQNWR